MISIKRSERKHWKVGTIGLAVEQPLFIINTFFKAETVIEVYVVRMVGVRWLPFQEYVYLDASTVPFVEVDSACLHNPKMLRSSRRPILLEKRARL